VTTAEPAQAQGFSISFGSGYGHSGYGGYRPYPSYRPYRPYPVYYGGYRPYPVYHGGYRPYPVYYGPRCVTRVTRVWDGWGYVTKRRQICR
jgi:hypothetical protein